MIRKHSLDVRTVCEIGCGAGGILASLQEQMDRSTEFVGFEISPQAHEMAKKFCRDNLSFRLGDGFDSEELFDLVLAMDVVEHVEDCFGFLRKLKHKGNYKILHIPLDLHCSAILRDHLVYAWRNTGHIHSFSLSTALEALKFTGYDIVDYFLTRAALERGRVLPRTRVMNLFRRLLPAKLCARLVGGYSLLVLAR
jgi:SAM-dependent methyltransferase